VCCAIQKSVLKFLHLKSFFEFHYVNVIQDLEEIENVHIVKGNNVIDDFERCSFLHFLETTICMGPRATFHNKILFAFKMFDVDGDGFVEKEEFEEIIGATLDSTGIEVDEKVLNNLVHNRWNTLMKGSGLTKLSLSDFKAAAKENSALLQPFSKTTDWMERILLHETKSTNHSILKEPKNSDDLLGFLNDALDYLDENEIEQIREKLRNKLIDRTSDLQIVPEKILQDLGLESEIISSLKLKLPIEKSTGNQLQHCSISSTKRYFLLLFYAAVVLVCIFAAVVAALMDKRVNDSKILLPLNAGRIFAYMAYVFISAIVLSFTSNIITKIANSQFKQGYVLDYVNIHMTLTWPLTICCIGHSVSHIFTYVAYSNVHSIGMGDSLLTLQGLTGILLLLVCAMQAGFIVFQDKTDPSHMHFGNYIFFVLLFIHAPVGYKVQDLIVKAQPMWMVLIPIAFMYISRKILETGTTFNSHIAVAEQKLGKVLSLRAYRRDDFHFNCGQYVMVKCNRIDANHWHALNIASSPHEVTLSFNVSVRDEWTQKLYELCGGIAHPNLQIGGPFGQGVIVRYRTIMLICAGRGIASCAGMLSHLVHLVQDRFNGVNRIHFYWIVKQYTNFQWFYEMLTELQNSTRRLSITIFMLKKKGGIDANVSAMMMNMKSFSSGLEFSAEDVPQIRPSRKMSRRIQPMQKVVMKQEVDLQSGGEIKMGPPNFKQAFETIRNELVAQKKAQDRRSTFHKGASQISEHHVLKKDEVGVLFFGPEDLGDRLWTHCQEFSCQKAKFIFHHHFADHFDEKEPRTEHKDSSIISVVP